MLHSKNPSVENLGKYMESFSEKKRFPAYSIGRGMRQVRSRSAELRLGPGEYKVDRDWVMNEKTEADAGAWARRMPNWSMPVDRRENADGTLKGIADSVPGNSGLGPGQYTLPPFRVNKSAGVPCHYFTKATESQEDLRTRKASTDVPGPGTYKHYSCIEMDEETKKTLEKIKSKKIETTWAAGQYSHMFAVMRPKASKNPNKPADGANPLKTFK